MPFTEAVPREELLLSGGRYVSVVRILVLRVGRPELFPFQRFATFAMSGTLSNGCPFQFWWAGYPSSPSRGEIRILSTSPPFDPNYASVSMPPDPPPASMPIFRGYRHVMSSRIWSGPRFVGLWNRTNGTPGSLVATYGAQGSPVTSLGTARWNYDGIYAAPGIDTFSFTLVGAPRGSEPLYIATFVQAYPGACCGRSRRRR